jgi:hypothetical protein
MLNAIGSAALTNEKAADASQKKAARTASVSDPKIKSKDQLRPSRRSQVIMSSLPWGGGSIRMPEKYGWVEHPHWQNPLLAAHDKVRCVQQKKIN